VRTLLHYAGYALVALIAGGGVYAGILANLSGPPTFGQQAWGIAASAGTAALTFLGARAGQFGKKREVRESDHAHHREAWNVPAPTAFFTARTYEVTQIQKGWTSFGSANPFTPKVLIGMPGVGKSQLAFKFAHISAAEYLVAWVVRAEHRQTVREDLRALGVALNIIEWSEDEDAAVIVILQWLNRSSGWLLIYDNCADAESISEYLPHRSNGLVLITSRQPAWRGTAFIIKVDPFGQDDARALLVQAEVRGITMDDAGLREVSDLLGGLPLALEQARAYVEEAGCNYSDYALLLRQLDYSPPAMSSANDAVYSTLAVALTAVEGRSKMAQEYLRRIAFLAPERIAITIFRTWDSEALEVDQYLHVLRQFSLIGRDGSYVSCHRIVQAAVRRECFNERERHLFALSILDTLESLWPRDPLDVSLWAAANELIPHITSVLKYTEFRALADNLNSYHQLADMMLVQRRFLASRDFSVSALALVELCESGQDHAAVGRLYADLGDAWRGVGNYEEAKKWHQQSLEVRRRLFEANHPAIANSYELLGNDYLESGDFFEAARFHAESVAVRARSYNSDRRAELASALNGLGNALRECGEYERARRIYLRAMKVRLSVESWNSLGMLTLTNGLAHAYTGLGKYQLAVRAHRRVLHRLEETLGPMHIRLAEVLHGLAEAYFELGQSENAIHCERRASAIYSDELGAQHSRTHTAHRALARYLAAQQLIRTR
jgi:tetratricopeptide (TPR) repeat protein